MGVFVRGQAWGMREAGVECPEIRKKTRKKDGSNPTLQVSDAALAKKKADPEWRGEASGVGGRPRALTTAQLRALIDLVFAERGKAKATVPCCRDRLPFLREVTRKTVR